MPCIDPLKHRLVYYVFTKHSGENITSNSYKIIVKDSGIGIPPEKIDIIFNRFTQVDGSISREYGGTGIGLAFAKEIIELHKGSISVTSKPGVGSEFILSFQKSLPVTRFPEKAGGRRKFVSPVGCRHVERGKALDSDTGGISIDRSQWRRFCSLERFTVALGKATAQNAFALLDCNVLAGPGKTQAKTYLRFHFFLIDAVGV